MGIYSTHQCISCMSWKWLKEVSAEGWEPLPMKLICLSVLFLCFQFFSCHVAFVRKGKFVHSIITYYDTEVSIRIRKKQESLSYAFIISILPPLFFLSYMSSGICEKKSCIKVCLENATVIMVCPRHEGLKHMSLFTACCTRPLYLGQGQKSKLYKVLVSLLLIWGLGCLDFFY